MQNRRYIDWTVYGKGMESLVYMIPILYLIRQTKGEMVGG